MTLAEVFEFFCCNKQLKDLHIDSRNLRVGDVFIALPGLVTDGRNYIPDAITRGAAAVMYEPDNYTPSKNSPIPLLPIEHLAQNLPEIAANYYHHPSKNLKIIGVTGTNGKTSITQYIAQLLSAQQHNCGVMGTLGNGIFPDLIQSELTTSDCCTIQRALAGFLQEGAQYVAMEVSSVGLDQDRLRHTHIDTGVFTNLSQDHLDYHHDMESYFAAKCKLFTEFALSNAIINLDDEYGLKILPLIASNTNKITYSIHNPKADVYLHNDQLHTPWGNGLLETKLMGKFNKSNTLAALSAVMVQGYSLQNILTAVKNLRPATGRMELVSTLNKKQPVVVVDYAHTPDALTKALQTLREYNPVRLFCVFGCGGDRDRTKRPLMMQAVIENCDEIIVTQDNPRTEDAAKIVADMLSGKSTLANITIELDRKQAIHKTIQRATGDDIVLIAGKGHENYQIIGTTKFPFSDQLVAIDALGE